MSEKKPLPKELQKRLEGMCQRSDTACADIKAAMRDALSDRSCWAGGGGRINKQQFLRRIGLDTHRNASATSRLWRELVASRLLPASCDYRLFFALGALGHDPQTWLEDHHAWAPRSVSRVVREVNDLLRERGHGEIHIGWYGVKKAMEHLHSLRS